MDDAQIDDLKQLIATTVSQAVSHGITRAENRIVGKIEAKIESLRQEMLDGFTGVGDTIDPMHTTLDDHEQRIVTLEQQTV